MNTREERHTLGKNNLLESLPVELLPRILLVLDCFSLRSLLQAYPSIARKSVVLLQEWKPTLNQSYKRPCFFSDCAELTTLYKERCTPFILSKYMVKIYTLETSYVDNTVKLDINERLPFFSKPDSVVVYFPGSQARVTDTELTLQNTITTVLQSMKGVAFHIGPPIREESRMFSLEEITRTMDSITGLHPGECCTTFERLSVIRVEGIECIEGITFSPNLMSLTVVFNNAQHEPVLRNLVFTSCFQLSVAIYYDDRVPFIENLGFELTLHSCEGLQNTLLLGHLPSLPGNLSTALPTHPDEGRDFGYLSVLQGPGVDFDAVRVIGGPTGIMEQLAKVPEPWRFMALEWKQTCKPLEAGHQLTIDLPGLAKFRFECLVEKAKFPEIVFRPTGCMRPYLSAICVIAHRGMDIGPLVEVLGRLSPNAGRIDLSLHVRSKSSNDHVPSIKQLWPAMVFPDAILEWRRFRLFLRLDLKGLRASREVTQAQLDDLMSSVQWREAGQIALV